MRTRKGGFGPLSLVRVSKKAYLENEKDCVDFFKNHGSELQKNKKIWNKFLEDNATAGLRVPLLVGETANEITEDYEQPKKQFCAKSDIVEKIRFPGSFRKGFGINALSLANGSIKRQNEGGTRRKRRKRRSK